MARVIVSALFLLTLNSIIIQSAPAIDFSYIWLQHTNQVVYVYDQLSSPDKNNTDWNESNLCRASMQQLVLDAKNGLYYANKMIDSIGRPSSGILEGRGLINLGSYDECLASQGVGFTGKYCIAQIQLPGNLSLVSGIPSSLYQNVPAKLGVCLPSTCNFEQISTMADRFSNMFSPALSVKVVECMESSKDQDESLDYVSLTIFGSLCALIFVLILIGTVFGHLSTNYKHSQSQLILNLKGLEQKNGYATEGQSILRQLLLAFSIVENLKKIFAMDSCGSDSIRVFHGIKFFAMIWIIFSHSISFSSQWINFNNPLDIRKTSHNLFSLASQQLLLNGTFSVDCFFFISGFLVAHILLKHLQRTDHKLNLPLFYLKRYLRMTPTMMAIIGFGATLLRYFGSGPEWANSTVMFDGWCRINWWVNSLYLHNFVNTDNMCLSHSWYSAVDTQFYLISPLLVYLLSRRPVVGVSVSVLLLAGSVVTTWVLTTLNNYPAVPYFNDIIPLETINSYYQNIYIKPYCRIGPYIVGILLAFGMRHSGKNVKLSKSCLVAGWSFTIVATVGVILAMLPANQGNIPGVELAAAYSSTSRIIWALGLSWITFVSQHNYGGLVSRLLSLRVWMPLSRLTYCAYLVHPVIIAIFYGSRHQTFDYSFYLIFYFTISNICITYVVSLLVALFVEYPIVSLGHILLKKA